MKIKSLSIAALPLAAFTLSTASPALADNVSARIISQMKSPAKLHPALAQLIGDWKGKGRLRPARRFPKSKVKCTMNATWVEGGRVVKQSMTCKSFLMSIKRTSYIAYDKATGRYVGMDFGNVGPDNVTFSGTGNGKRFDMAMTHYKPGDPKPKNNKLVINTNGSTSMSTVLSKVSSRPYEILNVTYSRIGGTI